MCDTCLHPTAEEILREMDRQAELSVDTIGPTGILVTQQPNRKEPIMHRRIQTIKSGFGVTVIVAVKKADNGEAFYLNSVGHFQAEPARMYIADAFTVWSVPFPR